jgi:hypothetical protein
VSHHIRPAFLLRRVGPFDVGFLELALSSLHADLPAPASLERTGGAMSFEMSDCDVLEHTPEGTILAIGALLRFPSGGTIKASYRMTVHLLLPVGDHVVRKPQNQEALTEMARLPVRDHLRRTVALLTSGIGVLGPAHSAKRRSPLVQMLSRFQLARRAPHGQAE